MQLESSDESPACSVGLQSTPGSVIRATVRGPACGWGLVHVASGIERSGRNGLRPNRRRAYKGAGIANT
jgi:hypothetical protein